MVRLMGDAIHDNAASLPAGLDLVAGYDTGTPDIRWTPWDWQRYAGLPQVHIDQGYDSTPAVQAHVIVFDVETGAWAPAQAAQLIDENTSPRPTIYCNRSNLDATVAAAAASPRWRGDVWLALPGWQPGASLPALPPGCRYVAVQNQLDVAGLYDLSLVLDPTWPYGKDREVIILRVPMPASITETFLYAPGAAPQHIVSATDQAAFAAAGLPVIDISYAQYQALAGQS